MLCTVLSRNAYSSVILIVIINLPSHKSLKSCPKVPLAKNNNINTKVTTILVQLYPQWLQILSKIWFSPTAVTSTPHL